MTRKPTEGNEREIAKEMRSGPHRLSTQAIMGERFHFLLPTSQTRILVSRQRWCSPSQKRKETPEGRRVDPSTLAMQFPALPFRFVALPTFALYTLLLHSWAVWLAFRLSEGAGAGAGWATVALPEASWLYWLDKIPVDSVRAGSRRRWGCGSGRRHRCWLWGLTPIFRLD